MGSVVISITQEFCFRLEENALFRLLLQILLAHSVEYLPQAICRLVKPRSTEFIALWNVAGALHRPNSIWVCSNRLYLVMNAVFLMLSSSKPV